MDICTSFNKIEVIKNVLKHLHTTILLSTWEQATKDSGVEYLPLKFSRVGGNPPPSFFRTEYSGGKPPPLPLSSCWRPSIKSTRPDACLPLPLAVFAYIFVYNVYYTCMYYKARLCIHVLKSFIQDGRYSFMNWNKRIEIKRTVKLSPITIGMHIRQNTNGTSL